MRNGGTFTETDVYTDKRHTVMSRSCHPDLGGVLSEGLLCGWPTPNHRDHIKSQPHCLKLCHKCYMWLGLSVIFLVCGHGCDYKRTSIAIFYVSKAWSACGFDGAPQTIVFGLTCLFPYMLNWFNIQSRCRVRRASKNTKLLWRCIVRCLN